MRFSRRSSRHYNLRFGVTTLLLSVTLIHGYGCSNKNPIDSGPPNSTPSVASLTVTPNSGTPLTTVTTLGLDSLRLNSSDVYAFANGELTPVFVALDGTVSLTIPAYVDSVTKWIDTTVTSVSIVVIDGTSGDTLAVGENVFTVSPLAPAPGATATVMTHWQTISSSLQIISDAIPAPLGAEDQVVSSMLSALDSLLNSNDPRSLATALSEATINDPQSLELIDALLSVSGLDTLSQQYAMYFQTLADSVIGFEKSFRSSSTSKSTTSATEDDELAWKMQMYVQVKEFGETVVQPTATDFAVATGAIGLIGNVPIASVLTAALSLTDFIINKFVVGLLPANIDSLTLSLNPDTVAYNGISSSEVMLYASNNPTTIGVQDVVSQILNGLGLASSLNTVAGLNKYDKFKDVLLDVASFTLGLFQAGIASYSEQNPELNLDVALATLPSLKWHTRIVDERFVELKTFTPTMVESAEVIVEWKATGEDFGEGRVFVVTATSLTKPSCVVVPQLPGFEYSGGAFGEDIGTSETITLWVAPGLVMEITDFAKTIPAGGANGFKLRAGYMDAVGVPHWEPDIAIDLQVVGGTADPFSGITDVDGEFVSVIFMDSEADSVVVRVTAVCDVGSFVENTVVAIVPNEMIAFIDYVSGAESTIWTMNPDGSGLAPIRTLPNDKTYSHMHPSPNGKSLLYTSDSFNGPSHFITNIADRSYFDFTRLFKTIDFGIFKHSWSPDGLKVVFSGIRERTSSRKGVFVYDISSGQITDLRSSDKTITDIGPLWSPLGDKFAVLRYKWNGTTSIASIGSMDIDGAGFTTLITYPDENKTGRLIYWLPDGQRVLVLESTLSSQSLVELNVNGGGRRTLYTAERVTVGDLSPDGSIVNFHTGSVGSESILDISSGTRISAPDVFGRFSPDGKFIVYTQFRVGEGDLIYKFELATGNKTLITTANNNVTIPVWVGGTQ